MEFSQPIADIIRSRSSWRGYQSLLLEPELRQTIIDFIATQKQGPLGSATRFKLIEKDDPMRLDNASLGTYGFIKNARNFIAGAVGIGSNHWEDYGYNLEKIILKMTDLGLGTCWLGGTFRRSEFAPLLELQEDEVIPAITPVGYGTAYRAVRDRVIRWGAKSKSRKAWESLFFDWSFNLLLSADDAGDFAPILELVRLAPSASNRQPWRIVRQDDSIHFYLQRTPNYSGFTKSADLQRVDMGIAMCHFELAAREAGLNGEWVCSEPKLELPELAEYVISWQG